MGTFDPMPALHRYTFVLLAAAVLLLFLGHLVVGSVPIALRDVVAVLLGRTGPSREVVLIVQDVRLPQAITAALSGSGLAASGLMMQTFFRNPLAGPSVLGISSGASLGVAVMMLVQPVLLFLPIPHDLALIVGALCGAMGILFIIMLADRRVGDGITLLIIGLMIGYLCSALISVLQVAGSAAALKGFVLWGMGSFAGVPMQRMQWFSVPLILGIVSAMLLVKPLNALLMGQEQAATMGVEPVITRRWIMWTTGVLASVITAFCGPIAFLGLATPHVARGLFRTSDHRVLMPASLLGGAMLALFCDLVVRLPVTSGIPLNAVTSLLGAPVVAWVLLSGKRWARSA